MQWPLRPELVPVTRRGAHATGASFDDVIAALLGTAAGFSYRAKRGCREAKGHTRPEFFFSVQPDVFDLFFNSRSGYRAQFCGDHRVGAAQNGKLIRGFEQRLLAVAVSSGAGVTSPGFSLQQIRSALSLPSAKVWMDEYDADSTLNKSSVDAESLIAINIPHWVKTARTVSDQVRRGQSPNRSKEKALLGIQAPEGRRLVVFGAWLSDSTGQEYVVPSKRYRAKEIRLYGFS